MSFKPLLSYTAALLMVSALSGPAYSTESVDIKELQQKSEQGDLQSQLKLADYYYQGGPGIEPNPAKAAEMYATLGDKGFAQAQLTLGLMYIRGEGVPKNNAEGVKWLSKAAEQRVTSAQYFLGIAYEEGHGVKADLGTAYKWYEIAAAMEHEYSKEALKRLSPQMTSDQIKKAEEEATQWWLQHHH